MAYETNTTTNRFNITKGWKTASFPETLSLYSRDNVLYLKIFLFLKAYFTLRRTKLISCDIRNTEDNSKLLYLVINTITKKRKRKKVYVEFKRTFTSVNKYSPLRHGKLYKALTLCYINVMNLKKKINAKVLPQIKQTVTQEFYSKSRINTWLNYLYLLTATRQKQKLLKNSTTLLTINNKKYVISLVIVRLILKLNKDLFSLNQLISTLKLNGSINSNFITYYSLKFNNVLTQLRKYHKILKFLQENSFQNNLKQLLPDLITFNQNLNSYKKNMEFYSITKIKQTQAKYFYFNSKKSKYLRNSLNFEKKKIQSDLTLQQLHKRKTKKYFFNSLKQKILWLNLLNAYQQFLSNYSYNLIKTVEFKKIFLKKTRVIIEQIINRKSLNKINSRVKISYRNLDNDLIKGNSKIPLITKAMYVSLKKIKQKRLPNLMFLIFKSLRRNNKITRSPRTFTKTLSFCANFKNLDNTKYVLNSKKLFQDVLLETEWSEYDKYREDVTPLLSEIEEDEEDEEIQEDLITKYNNSTVAFKKSFRENYKLNLIKRIKFSYTQGLQNILFKYFKMQFKIKTIQPLTQYKNTKFLRLVYPEKHHGKMKVLLKKIKDNKILYKNSPQILGFFSNKHDYLSTNLQKLNKNLDSSLRTKDKSQNILWPSLQKQVHVKFAEKLALIQTLQIQTNSLKLQELSKFVHILKSYEYIKTTNFWSINNILSKFSKNKQSKVRMVCNWLLQQNYKINLINKVFENALSTNQFKKIQDFNEEATYFPKQTILDKKQILLKAGKKAILLFNSGRLQQAKRSLIMREFTPVLSLAIKYMNPQLIADHIAKEFEKTKNHKWLLSALGTVLRTLKFARSQGFRIAIHGRINSADKTRVYYIKKNVLIRQQFIENVNFASAQAKGRIGSFGIKVWLF